MNKKIFKIIGLLLVFMLGLSVLSFAQKSPKSKFTFPTLKKINMPKVEQVTLKNGMKLFLVEDHDYPTIDMRAMFRAGSVYEPADKIGLASITGDVLRTGGTKHLSGDEIDKKLETMAASIETGIGTTSGYASVSMLKENLPEVLNLFADILMNPIFADEKIDLEKVQARSAIARRNDNIHSITGREFNKLIYGADSPYARRPEYATIDAIQRQDIVNYYKKFFAPNNMIMAVWGDFKTKDMVKKIAAAFADWKKRDLNIPPIPKVDYKFRYALNYIEKTDVNQTSIMLGYIGGLMNNPDLPALNVMNKILSFDRMFKNIRTDKGLAYSVWGNYGSNYNYPGVFTAGAQTKSESTVQAIELMLQEMKRMMAEMVSEEELQRAKDQYLNSFVFNFDSKAKIINRMLTYAFYGYPLDFADQIKQGVEKVTREDVFRVAKKYLKPDQVQILVVGNQADFDKPLSTLGKVNVIDISIPEPKMETPEATAETLEKGKNFFRKAIDAMGGMAKISGLKNYVSSVNLTQVVGPNEMSFDAKMISEYPDKFKMIMKTPQGEMQIIVNGEKAIMKSPMGSRPFPENQRKSLMANSARDPLVIAKYLDDYQIQFIGKEKFNEKDAVDLLFTKGDNVFHLYFDPNTLLILGSSYQETLPTGPATVDEFVDDFREVNGVKIPFHTVGKANGKKQSEVTIKDFQFNAPLEATTFNVEK
ncbi:MAG: insulinase family protein [Calditrichaeota bacterium]|nr:insulinase family protein [Calditrichota bacterium]